MRRLGQFDVRDDSTDFESLRIKEIFQKAPEGDTYNKWLVAEIQKALDDPRPNIPHAEVMADLEAELAVLEAGQGTVTRHFS